MYPAVNGSGSTSRPKASGSETFKMCLSHKAINSRLQHYYFQGFFVKLICSYIKVGLGSAIIRGGVVLVRYNRDQGFSAIYI